MTGTLKILKSKQEALEFKVCKPMHHHTIQTVRAPSHNLKFASPCIIIQFKQINQLDATISPVYNLTFFSAQHVSGVLTPIIRSSTTAVEASGFAFGAW